ncbi:MAG: macrocin O-methyltransferase [Lachnospiraceae bacterium]|nr:macrocin O-methyltransferase [Lachnospiraceae bacterium]
MENIKNQLIEMGIDRRKIDTSFVEMPLLSRITFLQRMSEIQRTEDAAVAEVGVFEGDFAKWINRFYCNQMLHLFDTFEGFDKRDIEKDNLYSNANVGDYANTSVEMVMKKMPFPEKVVIHKGYFPDTTQGINELFAFVNLDVDLYEPTYKGLMYFKERMISGGIILVHDYFATNFQGPRNAVDRFIEEMNDMYRKYPIGDGISIMITGF